MIRTRNITRSAGCFFQDLFESGGGSNICRRFVTSVCLVPSLLVIFLSTGCTSGAVALDDVMIPYVSLKQTIKRAMPQTVVAESVNGREMTSGFFSPTNFYESATNKPERMYAKVVVLGSSRPFRIEVSCIRERKSKENGKYYVTGEDTRLAKQLAQYFKDALADRREDRNMLNEFRPF